jgi:hypothetical protein
VTNKLLAAAGVLIVCGTAMAQQRIVGDGYLAPPMEPTMDWWTILYFVVACLGTAVVGFKNARRTHLD